MYDMATRVRLVKNRVHQKLCRREKRILGGLSAMCLLLCVSLAGTFGAFTGLGHPSAPGMYGSMLLHEDVGGYVLVGVLSFTAAVVITVLCMRSREKAKGRDEKKEESEE